MALSASLCPPTQQVRPRLGQGRRSPRRPIVPRKDDTPSDVRPRAADCGRDTPPSDEELLGHYRDSRRPEDFAELVRRHSGELGRYLARYLGDAALAEDVLQDTFLQVHSKCELYRDGWPARPWLYTVAIRRAVDALRRARRMPAIRIDGPHADDGGVEPGSLLEVLASDEPGPLERLQRREQQRWVRESVARLPEPQRQVLVLAYDQGLSYAEIVDLLGVTMGTVKSRLHAAVARLRALAERYDRTGRR